MSEVGASSSRYRRRRASGAPRHLSVGARLALGWEIVKGGLVELWAHKLRSTLTLTLLMLGVFALVVMTSVLDGVMDKIGTGFSGMSWDGTIMLAPKSPETTEDAEALRDEPGPALRGPAATDRAEPDGPRLPAARDQGVRGQGRRRHRAHLGQRRLARLRALDEPARSRWAAA